jgi:hypothetical protein
MRGRENAKVEGDRHQPASTKEGTIAAASGAFFTWQAKCEHSYNPQSQEQKQQHEIKCQHVPQTKTEKNCSFLVHGRWSKYWPVMLVNMGARTTRVLARPCASVRVVNVCVPERACQVLGDYKRALGVMGHEKEASAKKSDR